VPLRRTIFWLHLLAGTVAGAVILLMSVTGVLLTYERQMAEWADMRTYRIAATDQRPQRLSMDDLVRRVQAQEKAPLGMLTVRAGDAPVSIVAGTKTLYVDPFDGSILGEGAPGVRAFFRGVRDWHRWLGVAGEGRTVARAITGACNLAFLVLVTTGIYLWWPRTWSWRQIRQVVWFRAGLLSRARDFNWHNTIGFWCCIPLFIVVLSATVISYRWSSNLVYRIAGEEPPRAAVPAPQTTRAMPLRTSGLDGVVLRAQEQVSNWKTIALRVPAVNDRTVSITIDEGSGGEPQKRSTLIVDLASSQVTRWEPFSAQSAGRRWRSLLRFAHTGEAAGIVGQTVAGIASMGGVFLVWTGISLALRRFNSWRNRRDAQLDRAA
jgi:uncharacterized iron-regulated membrane protein